MLTQPSFVGNGWRCGIDLPRVARIAGRRIESQAREMLLEHEVGEGFEHRHFDELPLAGAQPVDHRRHRGVGGVQPRGLVGDERRQVARARVAIDAAEQVGGAGERLYDVVIGL